MESLNEIQNTMEISISMQELLERIVKLEEQVLNLQSELECTDNMLDRVAEPEYYREDVYYE
jgi:predicted HAD superfamily phosphohydrolase